MGLDNTALREAYKNTLDTLIANRQKEADKQRNARLCDIIKNPAPYRKELKEMLGWPLTEENHDIPSAKKELIKKENGVNVYRIQLDILGGLKFFGLLFEQEGEEKRPLVIAQHGGWGTPELCSGLFDGDTSNYNGMITDTLKQGVHIFAPQLLLWQVERFGVKYDRTAIDAKLKQLGSSITAVEIYGIMKSLDYLSALDNVDAERIGMLGLSYGGFYTLFAAAVDTRIKAAVACSQYNNRFAYPWPDWTWRDSGFKFLDNEVAALVYPRHLCIEIGDKDEHFDVCLGKKEFEKLSEALDDTSWLDFRVFEGTHEFYKGGEDIGELVDILKGKA